MLTGFLTLVMLITKLFPGTPLARTMHLYSVELPIQLANQFERRHIFLAVVFLCCFQSFAMIGAADVAILYAAEVSMYADAALASYLAMLATRLNNFRTACQNVISRAIRFRPRQRRRRTKSASQMAKKPSNDEHPAFSQFAKAA